MSTAWVNALSDIPLRSDGNTSRTSKSLSKDIEYDTSRNVVVEITSNLDEFGQVKINGTVPSVLVLRRDSKTIGRT